jgi:hypothetical protein
MKADTLPAQHDLPSVGKSPTGITGLDEVTYGGVVASDLDDVARIAYDPAGICCTVRFPLSVRSRTDTLHLGTADAGIADA